jgi:hypothetical protein
MRARALDDPLNMVALWMIGLGDPPEQSAEICIFEIFGRDVEAHSASVGMGVHPFADPRSSTLSQRNPSPSTRARRTGMPPSGPRTT